MPAVGSTRIDDSSASGKGIVLTADGSLSVNIIETSVLLDTVPADKVWRLRYAEIACRGFGRWQIKVNGVKIGGGLTGPAREHDRTDFPEYLDASSGEEVEVLYLYSHGPSSMPINVFIGIVEI